MDGNRKKPDKKRSSILKKAVEPNPEHTETTAKPKLVRRISFSGKKSVKEFVLDDDKNTVWGTSYEESAESGNAAQSESDPLKDDVVNYSMDMDIETDLVVPCPVAEVQDKENETPEFSVLRPSLNFSRQFPLAHSTMIGDGLKEISFTHNPPSGIWSDKPAAAGSHNVDTGLQFRSPPKQDIIANRVTPAIRSPFYWARDRKRLDVPKIYQNESLTKLEESSSFCPSPLPSSELNRDTTIDMNISSLGDTLVPKTREKKSKAVKKPLFKQSIDDKGKKIIKEKVETVVSGAFSTLEMQSSECQKPKESFLKGDSVMDLTCAEEVHGEQYEKNRKTMYFSENNDGIELTNDDNAHMVMSLIGKGEEGQKGKSPSSMNITLMPEQICQGKVQDSFMELSESETLVSKSSITSGNAQMELTLVPEVASANKKSSKENRRTILFAAQDMSLTEMSGRVCGNREKQRKSQMFQDEEIQNVSMEIEMLLELSQVESENPQMELTLDHEDATSFKNPSAKNRRRTTHVRESMNLTEMSGRANTFDGRKSVNPQMELTLVPENVSSFRNPSRESRRTVYVRESMNITGVSADQDDKIESNSVKKSLGAIPKRPLDRPGGRKSHKSHMDLTLVPDDVQICLGKGQETIHYNRESMNLTGITGDTMEMTGIQGHRRTIYFTDQDGSMEIDKTVEGENPVNPSIRKKSVCFSDEDIPLDMTTKSLAPSLREKLKQRTISSPVARVAPFTQSPTPAESIGVEDYSSPQGAAALMKRSSLDRRSFLLDANLDIDLNEDEDDHYVSKSSSHSSSSTSLLKQWEELNSSQQMSKQMMSCEKSSVNKTFVNVSEDNTMKIHQALLEEQKRLQKFKSPDPEPPRLSQFQQIVQNAELLKTQMLVDESLTLTENEGSSGCCNETQMNINLDNTYVQLGFVTRDEQPHEMIDNNRKSKTFIIAHHDDLSVEPEEEEEEIPAQEAIALLTEETTQVENETMRSEIEKINNTSTESPEILPAVSSIPSAVSTGEYDESILSRLSRPSHSVVAKRHAVLKEIFKERLILEKNSIALKDTVKITENVKELHNRMSNRLNTFAICPNRIVLPKALPFHKLLANMVKSTFPRIWYIDKYTPRGILIFKHRQITTFEIMIGFDPKEFQDIDSLHSDGILTFKRFEINDCDWYTERDPARKSPLWIYLHTQFRRKVIADGFLSAKYYNSLLLGDLLEYIDNLCSEIYGNRPHIRDLIRLTQ